MNYGEAINTPGTRLHAAAERDRLAAAWRFGYADALMRDASLRRADADADWRRAYSAGLRKGEKSGAYVDSPLIALEMAMQAQTR